MCFYGECYKEMWKNKFVKFLRVFNMVSVHSKQYLGYSCFSNMSKAYCDTLLIWKNTNADSDGQNTICDILT